MQNSIDEQWYTLYLFEINRCCVENDAHIRNATKFRKMKNVIGQSMIDLNEAVRSYLNSHKA